MNMIAVAALGIAFGSSDVTSLGPMDISNAYSAGMTAAAASAFLSALLALLVITTVEADSNDVAK
jgi:hypothetical protein